MIPFQSQPLDEPHGDAERATPAGATATETPSTNPGVWFEPTDISLRGVLVVLVVSACTVLLLGCLVLLLFRGEERRQSGFKASSIPLASQKNANLPAEPRLEQLDRVTGLEASDVYLREAADEAKLRSYGRTDEAGFVHVPIDWAIQQAADRLPVRKESSRRAHGSARPVEDQGLLDRGESNSGRILQGNSP